MYIKNIIRRQIVKSKIATKIIQLGFKVLNTVKYSNKIFNRGNCNIFDIKELSKEMPYTGNEPIFDNNMYGSAYTFKTYTCSKKNINAYIEHGLYFGDHYDKNQWYADKIITFSNQRFKHLKNKEIKKDIYAIGPYIHYAKELFSEETRLILKKNLGKTLLVFPVHSTSSINIKYNIESFSEKINSIKNKYLYDNVLVCLYWNDIHNKEVLNSYSKRNYKICTAGHKWDKDFLNRLKTIINLSDTTISNDVGTHIGYCIHLRKPHTIIEFENNMEALNKIGKFQIIEERKSEKNFEIEEVKAGFYNDSGVIFESITDLQLSLITKYWGLDCIKTESELYRIIS